jgi:DNA-binding response OmpR family regulator
MTEGNGATVLVIESNASLSKALVNVLENQGFRTIVVGDYSAGLEKFHAERPSLVLSELKIGDATAFDFMNEARSSKDNPGVPIILMSSTKNPKVITSAAKAGATDFMIKPFSPEVLGEKLEKALNRRAKTPTSSEADKFVAAGKQCIEQKRLQDAITLFAKAAKVDAESAEAFRGLADVCRIKKDMDQYEKLALKAAEIHARQDNFEAAQDIFLELRRYNAGAPNPFKAIAEDLAEKGDPEGAVRSFQKAALADPEDAEVYTGLSQAHMKLGNSEKAEQSVVAALKLSDDNPAARKLYRGLTGGKWTDHPESRAGKERAVEEERRGTVRFWIPDLMAEIKGREEHTSLIEMSVRSVGFSPLKEPFKEGEALTMNIIRIE